MVIGLRCKNKVFEMVMSTIRNKEYGVYRAKVYLYLRNEKGKAICPTRRAIPVRLSADVVNGPWIERTSWEETYRGKDRLMLSVLMERPDFGSHGLGHDLVLGHSSTDSSGKDVIISPAADERKISPTLDMFDRVMDRCEGTARKTSRGILCWLRSNQALLCYLKPFTFVSSRLTTNVYCILRYVLFCY